MLLAVLATNVYAESSSEQLGQLVVQLQKTPNDDALREKIIKLAQAIKPPPVVPEEAERRMARGAAAFKGAKSSSGYHDAILEFELATLAAPWYGDAYFNLGVAQDKAGNYEAALRGLRLAKLATPGSKEINDLIYEVEYRNEKAHSPEVVAAKQVATDQRQEVPMPIILVCKSDQRPQTPAWKASIDTTTNIVNTEFSHDLPVTINSQEISWRVDLGSGGPDRVFGYLHIDRITGVMQYHQCLNSQCDRAPSTWVITDYGHCDKGGQRL